MTNVGTYFPKNPSTKFVVKNIAPNNKRIKIFQYPIANGQTRDLLAIPGLSEADIRHSLLKGELLMKIKNQEIIITESDIDLIQFNNDQKSFLQGAGVTEGLEGGGGSSSLNVVIKQNVNLVGDLDGSNRIFTVPSPDKFINGSFAGSEFKILIRHNGRGLVQTLDYTISESGGAGSGYDTITLVGFIPEEDSTLVADYVTEP